jgi:hypothetical protein
MAQFQGVTRLRNNFLSQMGTFFSTQAQIYINTLRQNDNTPVQFGTNFWVTHRLELRKLLYMHTARIYMASAMQHGMTKKRSIRQADEYAVLRSDHVSLIMVNTSQNKAFALDNAFPFLVQSTLTIKETKIKQIFSKSRGKNVAINETTLAASQGSQDAISLLLLDTPTDRWITNPGLSKSGPCRICKPLHNTTRRHWGRLYPKGPPSHIGCVCEISFTNIQLAKSTARELRKQGN